MTELFGERNMVVLPNCDMAKLKVNLPRQYFDGEL